MEMDQNRLILGLISHSSQDFSNLFWLMELGSEVTTSPWREKREHRLDCSYHFQTYHTIDLETFRQSDSIVFKMASVRSLLQLSQNKLVKSVFLSASEDLKCVNLFCEKVGGPCVCRIERVLAREDLAKTVETVDLSRNKLTQLPPSLYKLNEMISLSLRDNDLTTLKAEDFSSLTKLESIDLRNNPLTNLEALIRSFKKSLPDTAIIYEEASENVSR
jgi:Leucine rich repeat